MESSEWCNDFNDSLFLIRKQTFLRLKILHLQNRTKNFSLSLLFPIHDCVILLKVWKIFTLVVTRIYDFPFLQCLDEVFDSSPGQLVMGTDRQSRERVLPHHVVGGFREDGRVVPRRLEVTEVQNDGDRQKGRSHDRRPNIP